jgi:hypothetical protein
MTSLSDRFLIDFTTLIGLMHALLSSQEGWSQFLQIQPSQILNKEVNFFLILILLRIDDFFIFKKLEN